MNFLIFGAGSLGSVFSVLLGAYGEDVTLIGRGEHLQLVPATYNHTSSMLQDIRKGRRTEIEALNGAVCKLAFEKSVSVPVNTVIYNLIKFKEVNNAQSRL